MGLRGRAQRSRAAWEGIERAPESPAPVSATRGRAIRVHEGFEVRRNVKLALDHAPSVGIRVFDIDGRDLRVLGQLARPVEVRSIVRPVERRRHAYRFAPGHVRTGKLPTDFNRSRDQHFRSETISNRIAVRLNICAPALAGWSRTSKRVSLYQWSHNVASGASALRRAAWTQPDGSQRS